MGNTLTYGFGKFAKVKVSSFNMQLRSLKDKSVGIVFMTEFQKVKSNPVQHWIFL